MTEPRKPSPTPDGRKLPKRGRHALLKDLWVDLMRVGTSSVVNVEPERIRGIDTVRVTGLVSRTGRLVVAALSVVLEAESIFEIGTYAGETTWVLAHNQPKARVYTLDLPGPEAVAVAGLELTHPQYFAQWDRGRYFHGTPEAERITQLFGDSATFDFAPYAGKMDLVYIDASHSYSDVRSDTKAAFGMLSELGTIVWDDYTYYPGVYAYVNEIGLTLDHPIFHVLGTRLAVYSRWNVLSPGR
ncbi:MAG TPA: class I SAM-dependent methyltransferase [Methylomirabilota bacterium]|nr:class I SAM-dependent methyltransferase [Methylomirabilota bacterium]